jgi:hypothetical protein
MRQLEVYVNDVKAGLLTELNPGKGYTFVYIRIAESNERSTYILKPAPWDETIATRKQIPANEHVTMQIARQVYGIVTAENGLCFTKDGQTVYITKNSMS